MNTFSFDCKVFVGLTVSATTEGEARAMIDDALDCANANFGAWPNGDPILGEASIDGEADLVEAAFN